MSAVTDDNSRPSVADAARSYRTGGVSLARLKRGGKAPEGRGWTTRSAEPEEFRDGDNIGLLCGWLSDDLVCVDIDSRDAIAKAEDYLPPTGAIEGRAGKPKSHWWFRVTDVPDWATSRADQSSAAAIAAGKHPGPFKRQLKHATTGEVLIDFQGSGGQAVVPPSVHDSGEVREWSPGHGIENAAEVPFEKLWDAVEALAAACGAEGKKQPKPKRVNKVTTSVTREEATTGAKPEAAHHLCPPPRRPIDVPMGERVSRCRNYLERADLAKSGRGGHGTTYRVARLIANDFAVDDDTEAMTLLRWYNERLKAACEEPWEEGDLEHKLAGAKAAPDDPRFPFGCKQAPPRKWDDPARVAEEFLCGRRVLFKKDTPFQYGQGKYEVVSPDSLRDEMRLLLERLAAEEFRRLTAVWEEQDDGIRRNKAELDGWGGGDLTRYSDQARRQLHTQRERLGRKKPSAAPSVTNPMVENALNAVRARGRLPDDTELDSWLTPPCGPPVLAVANGLLDPLTGELRPHDSDWFSTVALPVRYDRDAPLPTRWLAFLDEVTEGDRDKQAVIQELFGGCLDRTLPAKWFVALLGNGDNGKSVLLTVLRTLLGSGNCSAVGLGELSTNRFAAFNMYGKLANVVGDQGYLESADEGKLKMLTGGDSVTFEQKNRDPFSAVNRTKLVFACNTLPTFGDKSDAVWNRLTAVPLSYTVPADKKNPALLTEGYWADELSGILTWALDGGRRLRGQGGRFTRSAACEALKVEHRQESNPARRFLLEDYEHTGDEADQLPVGEMYGDYKQWTTENGLSRTLPATKFAREVDSAFPGVGVSKTVRRGDETVRVRVGLRRKDAGETQVQPRIRAEGESTTELVSGSDIAV